MNHRILGKERYLLTTESTLLLHVYTLVQSKLVDCYQEELQSAQRPGHEAYETLRTANCVKKGVCLGLQ